MKIRSVFDAILSFRHNSAGVKGVGVELVRANLLISNGEENLAEGRV